MTSNSGRVLIRLIAGTAALALTLTACAGAATPTEEETCLTVGAIYVGPINDAGYNQAQHDGLLTSMHSPTPLDTMTSTVIQSFEVGSRTISHSFCIA